MATESPIKPPHRGMRILLNVVGVLCLIGVAFAFLPTAWIAAMIDWFARVVGGVQVEPLGPLFWYAFRATEVVFLGVAWMCFVAARDPERHRDFIHAVMVSLAAWVVLCPVFGYTSGIPFVWYISDTLQCLIALVLFAILYPRKRGVAS